MKDHYGAKAFCRSIQSNWYKRFAVIIWSKTKAQLLIGTVLCHLTTANHFQLTHLKMEIETNDPWYLVLAFQNIGFFSLSGATAAEEAPKAAKHQMTSIMLIKRVFSRAKYPGCRTLMRT